MLIFDQLKRNDPHLRLVTLSVLAGLFILLVGLWWVQIVSSRDYQASMETQSYRTVRIPAIRGKILDRNNTALAQNRPIYNIGIYLEDLSPSFRQEFKRIRPLEVITNDLPFWKAWLRVARVETNYRKITLDQTHALERQARNNVASNAVWQLSAVLQQPLNFDPINFQRHYEARRPLLYPVVVNATPNQLARFSEHSPRLAGVDVEMQATRDYPFKTTTAHLLGQLRRDPSSKEGEDAFFNFYPPDYRGVLGLEYGFDADLRGRAGGKSVLVNSVGYRQTESIWQAAEPGSNVVLTIDVAIQKAAEDALTTEAALTSGKGAAVVMDVYTGDVLALASVPTYNPNSFAQGISSNDYRRLTELTAEKNRATGENYHPGSIFKTIVALASLERGLAPKEIIDVKPDPNHPTTGGIFLGKFWKDTAPPDAYNLRLALIRSCNSYFITNGIRYGIDGVIQLGQRLHLGEPIGLPTLQEADGHFPTMKDLRASRPAWGRIDSGNLCIGQGKIDVTPLQMAVMAAALANGGNVLWPRIVDRIESQDPIFTGEARVTPKGRIRDTLGVRPQNLALLKEYMKDDVESADGTGKLAAVPNYRICGKTGTAQVMNARNELTGHTVWFLSFAPYEQPRYAVVVMVENGASGGITCAPIAKKIYEAIVARDRLKAAKGGSVAQN